MSPFDRGCVKTLPVCYGSLVILRGKLMRLFVEQADRGQSTLLPECLDDFINESNPVRVIDVFVNTLDLAGMGFDRAKKPEDLFNFETSCDFANSFRSFMQPRR
jgi:hypothetical protein